jgi:hypothetical protein
MYTYSAVCSILWYIIMRRALVMTRVSDSARSRSPVAVAVAVAWGNR